MVVDAFKETKEPNRIIVNAVVVAVDDTRDTTNDLSIALSDEQLHGCVFVKRILVHVQQFFAIHLEGGYPVGIILIKQPLRIDERGVLLMRDGFYRNTHAVWFPVSVCGRVQRYRPSYVRHMKTILSLLACLVFVGTVAPATAQFNRKSISGDVNHLYAVLHKDSSLWDRVAEFCDLYPRRLSGTPILEQGIEYLVSKMMADGWEVKTQEVMVPHWVRGKERLHMLTQPKHEMAVMGLGGSIGTDGDPLEADVLVVTSFDDLESKGAQAEGKIVVWNVPFTTYGETVKYRYGGPSAAAKHGAVASLVRSIGPYGMQTPHTGGIGYDEDVDKIPAAAITMEDAMLMQRMQDRGLPIRLSLSMEAEMLDDKKSHNIVIEIPGKELPKEVVVMGGHIDAWDVGTGAMDDGSGCFVTWRALEAIRSLPKQPKRTIRVVFWTNEENGLRGGQKYAELTTDEKHVLAMEVDGGTFRPTGFSGDLKSQELMDDVDSLMTFTSPRGRKRASVR